MPALIDDVRSDPSTTLARWTVEQYHRMNEAAILPDGSPVELIDGVLVIKDRRDAGGDIMTHGPRHASLIQELGDELNALIRPYGYHLRSQLPVTLHPDSEPEPDLAVVRGAKRDYRIRHPGPEDVILLVEGAYSSLSRDRKIKTRLYASHGIPEYWIVDLQSEHVEVYRDPVIDEGRYAYELTFGPGDRLTLSLDNETTVTVEASDFLL